MAAARAWLLSESAERRRRPHHAARPFPVGGGRCQWQVAAPRRPDSEGPPRHRDCQCQSGTGTERLPTEAARPQPIRSRRPGAGAPNDGAGPGPAGLANLAWPGPPVGSCSASVGSMGSRPSLRGSRRQEKPTERRPIPGSPCEASRAMEASRWTSVAAGPKFPTLCAAARTVITLVRHDPSVLDADAALAAPAVAGCVDDGCRWT